MMNTLAKTCAMLVLSYAAIACVHSQEPSVQVSPGKLLRYQPIVDDIVIAANEAIGFSGTVLVANSKDVIYQRSIGFADKEQKVHLNSEYRFAPGSVIKEFSTVALMLLKQQGKIRYSDKVIDYISWLPDWASAITIEHLLTHTAGLGEIKFATGMQTADVIEQIKSVKKLKYLPGEGFSYGNLVVVLRALIIEKTSGQSYKNYIEENIFKPAGMKSAFARDNIEDHQPLIAFGEKPLAIDGVTAYTTASDLYLWEKALWNNTFFTKQVLSSAIVKPSLGGEGSAYFDFGAYKSNSDGSLNQVWHPGTYPSHYALKSIDLDKDLFIVLLSRDGRNSTLSEIREYIINASEHKPLKFPSLWWLSAEMSSKGYESAIKDYKSRVKSGEFIAKESELIGLGYGLNHMQELAALAIMALSVELFPQSANAYDSYAELLLMAKRYKQAKPIVERGMAVAKKSNEQFILGRLEKMQQQIIEHTQLAKP